VEGGWWDRPTNRGKAWSLYSDTPEIATFY
jgi:hypothetical protein